MSQTNSIPLSRALEPFLHQYDIKLDAVGKQVNQSQERFLATVEGARQSFNMHDYPAMYGIPMLYDAMMFGILQCRTPMGMAATVAAFLERHSVDAGELRVLEIGAGSGAFGEALRNAIPGLRELIGLDIIPEARDAAFRDRPSIYDEYLVADLCRLDSGSRKHLTAHPPSCVAVASATGWGNHIPKKGFEEAFGLLQDGGWFVFHVKPDDPDPECIELCGWIDQLIADDHIVDVERQSLFHRMSTSGAKIFYDIVIGRKDR